MSASAPVEIPEPIYRYYATPRESGPCAGGCGDVILPGELMAQVPRRNPLQEMRREVDEMIDWMLIDWHWLMILTALAVLLITGWVVVVVEDDGDWWVF